MTSYVCDLCGWQSEDRATALAHVASEHGIKDPSEVGRLDYDARGRLVLRSGDGETVIDLDQWLGLILTDSDNPDPAPCQHPPERLYTWFARDDTMAGGQALCVACCDCGAVLQGGAGLLDEVTQ